MGCIPPPCARRNLLQQGWVSLQRLRLNLSFNQLDLLPSCTDRRSGHVNRIPKDLRLADFRLLPDETLRCPAGCPLYAQERRVERDGSLRVLYAARIGHCRSCQLREQCQESATTIKARRESRRLLACLFTFLDLR